MNRDDKSEVGSTTAASTVLSYEWLDSGTTVDEEENLERLHHREIQLHLKSNKTITLRKNDTVVVQTDDGEAYCRIESLWQSPSQAFLGARWFLRPKELKDFALQPNELVLSAERRDVSIATVLKKVEVTYIDPRNFGADTDAEETTGHKNENTKKNRLFCRYRLVHGAEITLAPFDQERGTVENEHEAIDISSSESEDESVHSHIIEGEGMTKRVEKIRIGPEYQVEVGKFNPKQKVKSRNPVLIWSPGKISDEEYQEYLIDAGKILAHFLREQDLTAREPFSPISMTEAEELARNNELGGNRHITGSNLSTASMLLASQAEPGKSTFKRVTSLLKECDADAIMEELAKNQFDRFAAIIEIKRCPLEYVSAWHRSERAIFDESCRYADGKLRKIGLNLAPVKSMKEVVDYHYRFKVPDQFRKFQDKKREQAIKIVQCIEKRRYVDQTVPDSDIGAPETKKRKAFQCTETSVNDVTGALENRRKRAKALLVDVQKLLGEEKLAAVALAVRKLHRSYSSEAKLELFRLLEDNVDLQRRFLEFMPMQP